MMNLQCGLVINFVPFQYSVGKNKALKCVFVVVKWNKFVTVSFSGKTDIRILEIRITWYYD